MPFPFPGMNPYLENPELWPEVRHRLITAIADTIRPPLHPKYEVTVEKRIYLSDGEVLFDTENLEVSAISQSSTISQNSSIKTPPLQSESVMVTLPMPEEIREGYLEIKEVATERIVTVIEVLSLANKHVGKGREVYQENRLEVLGSSTHLVEIDLLRLGNPMRILSESPQADYRILISRRNQRPQAQLYAFSIRQQIPKFVLPLKSEDSEPWIDLQNLLLGVYERAGFDFAIDYTLEPVPPLKEEDKAWAMELLTKKGLR